MTVTFDKKRYLKIQRCAFPIFLKAAKQKIIMVKYEYYLKLQIPGRPEKILL